MMEMNFEMMEKVNGGCEYEKSREWYTVQARNGFLPMRKTPVNDDRNVVAKLRSGDTVAFTYGKRYGSFWFVYAPSNGMFGYVDSNYLK